MRKPLLPLGEWSTSLTQRTKFVVVCLLPILCRTYHVCAHMGRLWCASHGVLLGMIVDDIIYRSLFPSGNLVGRYHHLPHMTNDATSPVGRDPIVYVSHRSTCYYGISVALSRPAIILIILNSFVLTCL